MSSCQNEMVFLTKQKEVVKAKIRLEEQYLNYKERHQILTATDVIKLEQLVLKFFRILALIDAYDYFQKQNQTITNENEKCFLTIIDNCYLVRLNKFIKDLMSTVMR